MDTSFEYLQALIDKPDGVARVKAAVSRLSLSEHLDLELQGCQHLNQLLGNQREFLNTITY